VNNEDRREFAEFMTGRWPGLVRLGYGLGGDRSAAEDLAQSALASACISWRRVRRADDRDACMRRILLQWASDGYSLIGRVGSLWPEHKTIAEADGAAKYADPSKARELLQRDTYLRDAATRSSTSPGGNSTARPGSSSAGSVGAFRRSAAITADQAVRGTGAGRLRG
jgi:DNA-directed RNA polymerase specialized sigma24 family protein